MNTVLAGLLVAAGLSLQAFFTTAEVATRRADRGVLRERADAGDARARDLLQLLEDPGDVLATCVVGACLGLGAAAAALALLVADLGLEALGITVAAVGPLAVVLADALPRAVVPDHPEAVGLRVGPLLGAARGLLRPVTALTRGWTHTVAGPDHVDAAEGVVTREGLLELLEDPQESPFAPEERRLIRGVLELQELTVAECMTPLVHVVAVANDATVGVAADVAVRTQHSRLPVYEARIDHIVGVVHQADLLFVTDDRAPLAEHVRPVRFVPEAKRADALFAEMRTSGDHFAVVVDEYGGCVGIVTLEDLLEQLVGDIEDERDVVEPTLLPLEDGSWSVPADTPVDDVVERTGIELPEGDYETVAGLVLARLGRIPEPGEVLALPGVQVRVEEATDRAVRRVRLLPVTPAAAS